MAKRILSIDLFRGISIVLMVLFSAGIRIWDKSIFTHNVLHEVHIGDFILPMFLFASGLSVYHFKQKYKNNFLRLIERSAVIFYVWFLLSVFTAGFLKMDELLLGGILFIPAYFLCDLKKDYLLGICILIFLSYSFISTSLLSSDYLGGFGSAYFYLSITLFAIMISRKDTYILEYSIALAFLSLLLFPIDKIALSPSFMSVGIIVCTLIYRLIVILEKRLNLEKHNKNILLNTTLFIAKHPVASWIVMVVFILIPIEIIKNKI